MSTQGLQANKTGKALERIVETALTARFSLVAHSEYQKKPGAYGNELLLKNAPYTTLYNGNGHTEFLLLPETYELNIRGSSAESVGR